MHTAEGTVFVQLDAKVFGLVRAALPSEHLVHLPRPDADLPVEPRAGDVLFSTAMGGPHVGRLVQAGVDWIHVAGTGIDHFPVAEAAGATITCSRGVSAVPIAEYVLATMLAFAKDLPDTWITRPPRQWGTGYRLGGLQGATIGLVGLGAIGRAVAARALAFEMSVVACRRRTDASAVPGVTVLPLAEVAAAADHLVVAAPSTAATRHLVDDAVLALVRPGVHLVNIARGALIDHEALVAALDAGVVARASLDVTDPEPLPADHPLYTHPRVRLTPHVSWSAPNVEQRWVGAFATNLARYRQGQPLLDVIDVDHGY